MDQINYEKEKELGLTPSLNDVLNVIEDDAVFSPDQVAHLVGRAPKTVRRWCSEGRINAYSWGGRYVVYGVDIKAFMKKAHNRKKHVKAICQ
ncbi:helix-turn-helix domain-containing protein [Brevibacillus invocatus]|uniref:helix-turn-helix domain-containing protein n=1 Tax=Brevibacillus invocatus TaxID=173959 RepID=UPI0016068EEC|nr:helix-turn-helix domain-containing protein [Brevibacillus invocatus]